MSDTVHLAAERQRLADLTEHFMHAFNATEA
jgi:hypothetical protein